MVYFLPKMNLRIKFLFGSVIIITATAIVISTLYYFHLKKIMMAEALNKSEVVLREVESIREYVKSVLRPKMYALHTQDSFIIEAMSTTYISLNIMKRFEEKMPGYHFRRVSLNPHNPDNMADEFEEEMSDWFENDRKRNFWQGIVKKGAASYFVSMVPDYFEKRCLHCHSNPAIAPKSLIERYGAVGGFRFEEGDLAGVNSVSIPVSEQLAHIKKFSIVTFIGTIVIMGLLLFIINRLFEKLVIFRITQIISFFTKDTEASLPSDLGLNPSSASSDELDSLKESFANLNSYIRIARKGSGAASNFFGQYTVGETLLAGSLTWLHHGRNTLTDQPAALKIPFEDTLLNPIYTACLRNEAKILRTANHPNLINITNSPSDVLADVLVADALSGENMDNVIRRRTPMDDETILMIMRQIGDLAAYLHNMGVVHHDLRPQNMLFSGPDTVILVDAGLASLRDAPDAIFEASLGPQGDFVYMAPELLMGQRGDARSDIYSLGVWLYLMTAGQLPFTPLRASLKVRLHTKKDIKPPSAFNLKISEQLQHVILKAMAWDIEKRYQWVEDLLADLEHACGAKEQ